VRTQRRIDERSELELGEVDVELADARRRLADEGEPVLRRAGSIGVRILLTAGAVLAVGMLFVNFQLEAGIIAILLPEVPASLRYLLSTIAVVLTAVLGALLVERVLPTGAVPSWQTMPARERRGGAAVLALIFGGTLLLYASLAPARANVVHSEAVASAEAACETAQARVQEGSASSIGAARVACERAELAVQRRSSARRWDQVATVGALAVEALLLWALLEWLVVMRARALPRKIRRLEARQRAIEKRRIRRLHRVEGRFAKALELAGHSPRDIAAAWDEAWAAAPPPRPGRLRPVPSIEVGSRPRPGDFHDRTSSTPPEGGGESPPDGQAA
jgi:hypothetical protein